jgi:hypothetical protein
MSHAPPTARAMTAVEAIQLPLAMGLPAPTEAINSTPNRMAPHLFSLRSPGFRPRMNHHIGNPNTAKKPTRITEAMRKRLGRESIRFNDNDIPRCKLRVILTCLWLYYGQVGKGVERGTNGTPGTGSAPRSLFLGTELSTYWGSS